MSDPVSRLTEHLQRKHVISEGGGFADVANKIESLRGSFAPTSNEAIFLGIVRDMAVNIKRKSTQELQRLADELVQEFA